MQHIVAVGTHWHKIVNRVNHIVLTNRRDGNQMVDMNEAFANVAICLLKINTTNSAFTTIFFYAPVTCLTIALIAIYSYLHHSTFVVDIRLMHFCGKGLSLGSISFR